MIKIRWYGLVSLLSISALSVVPQQFPDRTPRDSPQARSTPVVDEATYLRVRTQLVRGFGEPTELPACHAAEIQRSERQFPEIRKDLKTFEAAIEQLGLQDKEGFSDDEELLIYRQYEALTSVHLEPARNKDGAYELNSYLLTFVPSFHSDCERSAPTTTKSQLITIDPEGRIDFHIPKPKEQGPGSSVAQPLNSMSNAGPLRDLPVQTDFAPKPLPPGPPIHVQTLAAPELRYRLLEEFQGRAPCECFHCDQAAREVAAFQDIQRDTETFRAIAEHLGLASKKNFTDWEKRAVYREYRKLSSIYVELLVVKYRFVAWSGQFKTWGLIDAHGRITVLQRTVNPAGIICPK